MSKLANARKALVNAAAGSIPVTAFIATLYNDYINGQWQERRELWEDTFEKKFKKLEAEIGKDRIKNVSNFASLFASATHAAMTDIEQDKIEYYATSVINAIKQERGEYSKVHVFLNLLRELTNKHLGLLYYLQNPIKNAELPEKTQGYANRSLHSDLIARCPWLSDDEELLKKIMKDLYNNGLTKLEGITFGRVEYNCSQYAQKYTTKLGDEFLAFITEQEAKNA